MLVKKASSLFDILETILNVDSIIFFDVKKLILAFIIPYVKLKLFFVEITGEEIILYLSFSFIKSLIYNLEFDK